MTIDADEAQTKPTINTLLERIDDFRSDVTRQMEELKTDQGLLRSEFQLFRGEVEIRLDRIEGMTNQTRAEMLNLRADFREWRDQLKESLA